jgi:flavin reductase (DIM6/NTAB) family NADH-FMN oxidoreductase RutF
MRRFASTVTVISLTHGLERHGITATSVTSVSMDPPSLLICVNMAGYFHDLLSKAERYCVNVLHEEHAGVSQAFSRPAPSSQRFIQGQWFEDRRGTPFLANAQANIFCRKTMYVPYGSHSIVVGEVETAQVCEDISPLLYKDGTYASSAPLIAGM